MKRVMIPIKGKSSDEFLEAVQQVFSIFSIEEISISNPSLEFFEFKCDHFYLSFNTKYSKRCIEVLRKYGPELGLEIDIPTCVDFDKKIICKNSNIV